MKHIKPIEDYPDAPEQKIRLWRRSRALRYMFLMAGITFIIGTIVGMAIAYTRPMIKTRNEVKIYEELRSLRIENGELARKNQVLYDVWAGRASLADVK